MEFRKNKTIYIQIGDMICEKIMTLEWKEEEKISSVRELGAHIEVNPNTVMRSYSHLQDLGIIYNKRGIGFFVSKGAPSKIKEMQKQDFIENELPLFFKKMELLQIDLSDLEKLYDQHLNTEKV